MSRSLTRSPALRALAALALALIAAATLPALASAVTVSVPERCYRSHMGVEEPYSYRDPETGQERFGNSEAIPVAVDGLAAGQRITSTLYVSGRRQSSKYAATADAAGSVRSLIQGWRPKKSVVKGSKPTNVKHKIPMPDFAAEVVVHDAATQQELARTTATIGQSGVAFPATLEFPRMLYTYDSDGDFFPEFFKPVVWLISGVSGPGETLTAYYLDSKRRVIGRQRLGVTEGACGYLRARKRFAPTTGSPKKIIRKYRDLRIQATSKYDPKAPSIDTSIPYRQTHRRSLQLP